jgi:hypothetical protein
MNVLCFVDQIILLVKNESLISIYHPEENFITYDRDTWWGDSWDPCDYGVDYDFSRSFFEQFRELLERVPHMPLFDSKSVNSRFCNTTVEQKNGYLNSAAWLVKIVCFVTVY